MQSNVASVEANLLAKKARIRNEKRVVIKEKNPLIMEKQIFGKECRENNGQIRKHGKKNSMRESTATPNKKPQLQEES